MCYPQFWVDICILPTAVFAGGIVGFLGKEVLYGFGISSFVSLSGSF